MNSFIRLAGKLNKPTAVVGVKPTLSIDTNTPVLISAKLQKTLNDFNRENERDEEKQKQAKKLKYIQPASEVPPRGAPQSIPLRRIADRLNSLLLATLADNIRVASLLSDKIDILHSELSPKADALVILWRPLDPEGDSAALELQVDAMRKPLHALMVQTLRRQGGDGKSKQLRIPKLKLRRDRTDGRKIEELLDSIEKELNSV